MPTSKKSKKMDSLWKPPEGNEVLLILWLEPGDTCAGVLTHRIIR